MKYSVRWGFVVGVTITLGCADLGAPTGAPAFAKGGQGKPGSSEPPPDGVVQMLIGYPAAWNGEPATGAIISGSGATVTPVGNTVDVPGQVTVMDYLQVEQGFGACFPDRYERGTWSFTDGQALFSFDALALDGVGGKTYTLTLQGAPFNQWPVTPGQNAHFLATDWSLELQGRGKKDPGCQGSGQFPVPVRVELRDLASITIAAGTAPFLSSPLTTASTTTSVFDHSPAGDGQVIDYTGATGRPYDGHTGYDWAMAEGTPIAAAAAGTVLWAANDLTGYCSLLGRIVDDQLFVAVEHVAPDGQHLATVYKHLQSAAVSRGDVVAAGDVIGLSGNTGCSTGPHLHFSLRGENPSGVDFPSRFWTRIDPFGWAGAGGDPYLNELTGALSQWLWVGGLEPPFE